MTRLRLFWSESLRFRLLALGLMPLLLAFPVLIAILVVVGGQRADSLLVSNLRSNLAGSRNYLEQLRNEAAARVRQLATSERLMSLVNPKTGNRELNLALAASARSSGLDFLLVASADGRVIGSSTGVARDTLLPDSYAIGQARIGVGNAAFERFTAEQLLAFSPNFPAHARVIPDSATPLDPGAPTPGLLINAAAHFPLTVNRPDCILVGGILLNRNEALIEHMREVIYPLGTLPGDAEGITAIYAGELNIAISRQRQKGQRDLGSLAPAEVEQTVLAQGKPWLGKLAFGDDSFMSGFEAIEDGDGRRIGMIRVSFPAGPYQQAAMLLLGMVAGLLALTMLAISILFLRTGREMTQRLDRIGQTMTAVSGGDRLLRVGQPLREDELGVLTRHFDRLLDTITAQDARQQAAQQQITDEASRRRTLFDKVSDGIVILNPDGTVFEANPKCAAMLGYTPQEFAQLRVQDWEARLGPQEMQQQLADTGAQGRFFETLHRRKDGSTYPAEVSLSRAEWGDRTFIFVLQRDITERKAIETELEHYRLSLEALVAQRTEELNTRSEQLDAIFALSPDGFVSFDRQARVNHANGAFLRMTGLAGMAIIGLDEADFSALLAARCLPGAMFPGVAALRTQHSQLAAAGAVGEAQMRRQLCELAPPASRVLEVSLRLAESEASLSQILYFRDVTHETEVDRMKSEFLTTAAHELRTPMASIYGYTELLRVREFEASKRQQILETISRQSQLMSSIINELLDLARIESRGGQDFVIERHAVQSILADTVSGYIIPNGRQAPLITQPAEPLYVNVDRQKMQQAVLNILSNAYKYSPGGGDVCLRLHVDDSARRVGIEVQDAGIGMKPEQLARVFERFYRADDSGNIPGTGLGMSIVKEIVELHHGEVRLASEPGQGTTVILWLPLAD